MNILSYIKLKLKLFLKSLTKFNLTSAYDIYLLTLKDVDFSTYKLLSPFQGDISNWAKSYSKFQELFNQHKKQYNIESVPDIHIVANIQNILDNICISQRLLLTGFSDASGNMMRHAMEGLAVVILLSSRVKIKAKKNGDSNFDYLREFLNRSKHAYPNKAKGLLEYNSQILNINDESLKIFTAAHKYYHNFSHPSSLSVTLRLSDQGWHMCGSHNSGTIARLKSEIATRISFIELTQEILQVTRPHK